MSPPAPDDAPPHSTTTTLPQAHKVTIRAMTICFMELYLRRTMVCSAQMSDAQGNGGTHDEDAKLDDSWKREDLSKPPILRKALITISGYAEESLRLQAHNKRRIAILGQEQAERDGIIMAALARIEDNGKFTRALAETTAVRLARLDNEKEVRNDDLIRVRRATTATAIQLADLDKREAAGRAKLDAQVAALEKNDDRIVSELGDTESRMIDATVRAEATRVAMVSQHEILKEDRADQRVGKQTEETQKHAVHMWKLGLIGMVTIIVVSAIVSRVTASTVHLPLPEPSTHSEH
jgi:hypothetical protein